jgi:S1-C subfamily serine protease
VRERQLMKTTLYQLLGVDPKASVDEIRAACMRGIEAAEAKGGDANATALLKQALEVLTDPLRRNAYDASLAAAASGIAPAQSRRSAGAASGMTPAAWVAVVVAVAAVVGAGVWTLARRDTPKPQSSPVERSAAGVEKTQIATVAAPAAPTAGDAASGSANAAGASASAPASTLPAVSMAPTPPVRLPEPVTSVPVRPPGPVTSVPVRPPEMEITSVPARPGDVTASAPAARSAENVFAEAAPSVARINVLDATDRNVGNGSGVVIEPGIVLTSCHVAKAGAKLVVKMGETTLPATIKLADEEYDMCRLAVPALRAPAVRIGSVNTLRTGQKVYAIGAPAGLELTISEGIVSSLRRIDEGTVIQTTAPISPGSSGGGLFDLSGQLVGIMTFQHRFGQNLNFALPADWIAQMRERSFSASGWRAAAVSASTGDKSSGLLVGQWLCRDWISGRAGSFRFDPDGRVNIAMSDIPAVVLNYGTSGKALVVFDANKGVSLTINELTPRKMILKGTDRSIACER